MKKYLIKIRDEDGTIYEYECGTFTWHSGEPLLIYKYGGINNAGERQMDLFARFQNCRAILDIGEVEDEG